MCVLSYMFRVDVNSWVERGGGGGGGGAMKSVLFCLFLIIHWWSIGLDVSLFLIVGAATGNYLQLHYHFHFHFHFQSQFILGQLLGTIYNYIIISITIFNLNLNLFLDELIFALLMILSFTFSLNWWSQRSGNVICWCCHLCISGYLQSSRHSSGSVARNAEMSLSQSKVFSGRGR